MFLCIFIYGKGYQQVTMIFNHFLQTVCHYFKEVLRAVVTLSALLLHPSPNYNNGVVPYKPNLSKHPLFQDCIGIIDGTHVKAVLSRQKHLNLIGRKGIPTLNVLATCDFNLCFTFVFSGHIRNTHDARMLAHAIHDPQINFPWLTPNKCYLVDSSFAH